MEYRIPRPEHFDAAQIFGCGQCFRFEQTDEQTYEGVAHGFYLRVRQTENEITLFCPEEKDTFALWSEFFDFNTDYADMARSFRDDPVLMDAARFSRGIRLLKQDPWETLCSFIISQNNNIPRIKGIIRALSERYGREVFRDEKGRAFYSFPSAQSLYSAGADALYAMKTGFRARYLADAAKTVCENPFFLTEVRGLPTARAAEKLKAICGVGDKVAACTLLFGFSRYDAFPVDVWVKRVLDTYYPDGPSAPLAGSYAGLAQQYLFYFERCRNNVYV